MGKGGGCFTYLSGVPSRSCALRLQNVCKLKTSARFNNFVLFFIGIDSVFVVRLVLMLKLSIPDVRSFRYTRST